MTNWIQYDVPDGYYCKSVSTSGTPVFQKQFTARGEPYRITVTRVWDQWEASLYHYGTPRHTLHGLTSAAAAAVAMELYLSELIAL